MVTRYVRRDAEVAGIVIYDHGDLLTCQEWLGPEIALPARIPMTIGGVDVNRPGLHITCPVTKFEYTATYGNAVYQRADGKTTVTSVKQFDEDYVDPDAPAEPEAPAQPETAIATATRLEPFS